jgi:hypothetical protein
MARDPELTRFAGPSTHWPVSGQSSTGLQVKDARISFPWQHLRANFTKTDSLNLLYLVVLSRIPGGKVVPTFPECALASWCCTSFVN